MLGDGLPALGLVLPSLAMGGHDGGALTDLLVILAVAAGVAMLLQRIRLAVIPGYLITGALVGPFALGLVTSPDRLEQIARPAIVLLMFGIGLQLHLSALRHRLWRMVLAGVGSCAASLLVSLPLAMGLGLRLPEAIALGMALSLSSTAVVLRVLGQRRELDDSRGRLCLAILVVQDILVLAMLALMPTLAQWVGSFGATTPGVVGPAPVVDAGSSSLLPESFAAQLDGWQAIFLDQSLRFAAIVLLIVMFRVIQPRMLRESLRGRSLEVLTITSLAGALGLAAAVQALGFSLEMGAFLAGFLLAGTPFRHHLSSQIRPLRDLLIAIFFTTVGMKLNPELLLANAGVILAGTVVLLLAKTVAIGGTCWLLGANLELSALVGLSLAQAGEFSLVFLGLAETQGVLSTSVVANAIAVVVLSLVLTPMLLQYGPQWLRPLHGIPCPPWYECSSLGDEVQPDCASDRRRVVVAGFGLVGRCIVENLEAEGFHCTVVELNHETVRREALPERPFLFGDIASEEILEHVDLATLDALILTIPDVEAVRRAVAAARRRSMTIKILARSTLVHRSPNLLSAGADDVTVDEMACADAMLGLVMHRLVKADGEPCDGMSDASTLSAREAESLVAVVEEQPSLLVPDRVGSDG